ncbi:phage baseplate plug family protein [Sporohalobacter salinus]|uniref:phage baseplate plug family protein n=1 Tax=Sporohalobacter salinus TaxID=1494606 RepID=UPI0019613F4E|nr:hypothetical protein [Sporohalobacter salinus]MBM7623643.1 hypothetical protein [Sporohalobacter salinus]
MQVNILPIDTEDIDKSNDRFAIDLDGNTYIFEVFWNPIGEFFSFNMYDENEEALIMGRKIIYGVDMLRNVIDERIPNLKIIPVDKTGDAEKTGITFYNFIESVKPVIIDG